MSYEVVFYGTSRGEFPVLEFLNSLQLKESAKCLSYLDRLMEHGNTLPSNIIKHLQDGLWELRPEYGGQEFRIFYFMVVGDTIILLHAIKKKTQHTAKQAMGIALRRMQEVKP